MAIKKAAKTDHRYPDDNWLWESETEPMTLEGKNHTVAELNRTLEWANRLMRHLHYEGCEIEIRITQQRYEFRFRVFD